jgi:hypothetical protein
LACLPTHGRIDCSLCYKGQLVEFDRTERQDGDWQIRANPLAWGNPDAEIVALGFSKGQTQSGDLALTPHDLVAFKGWRSNVGKILAHIGLLPKADPGTLERAASRLVTDRAGRFHFGSLIRCSVERYDHKKREWVGSGGGMLDKFVATKFGQEVAGNCVSRFLVDLPPKTRLVVLFGMGKNKNYIEQARELIQRHRPGTWRKINGVAYTDGKVTFVHVEHFASQGALIPNWLGEKPHGRATLGKFAQEAVWQALQ